MMGRRPVSTLAMIFALLASTATAKAGDAAPTTPTGGQGSDDAVAVYRVAGGNYLPSAILTGDAPVKLRFPGSTEITVKMWAPRKAGNANDCRIEDNSAKELERLREQIEWLAKAMNQIAETETDQPRREIIAEIHSLGQDLAGIAPRGAWAKLAIDATVAKADSVTDLATEAHALQSVQNEDSSTRVSEGGKTDQSFHGANALNRTYEFATQGNDTITLPVLQYGIQYCFRVDALASGGNDWDVGYFAAQVEWPAKGTDWWVERYVMPSVGLGLTYFESLTRVQHIEATAGPFLFIAAHITPVPTDRRRAFRDRISTSWTQTFHIELGGAVTSPWPNADIRPTIGFQGLLLGGGFSLFDNIVGASLSMVAGQGRYNTIDSTGAVQQKTQLLFSPSLNITTQADIVGAIVSIINPGKQ